MGRQRAGNVGAIFAEAMDAYARGRRGAARRLAKTLAEGWPAFGGTQYLLGLLALDGNQPRRAVEHLARAVAITPGQPAPHLALADALERCGDAAAAMDQCRTVLAADGDNAGAHARLGALLLEAGRPAEAVRHLAAALAVRADWPSALNNFGLALHRLGRHDDAAAALGEAVARRPDHAGFRANLAASLRAAGRAEAARAEAEAATRADSAGLEAWLELGLAHQALGDGNGAVAAFERAAAVAPGSAHAQWCLAEALRAAGAPERAAGHYRRCLDIDPDDRHGAQLGLALAGGALPAKAPEAYVRQLFDEYAETFDTALVDGLGYRAPALLAEALRRSLGALADRDVADLGCGTGLAAPVLRPLARRLDGIDLSPAMVAKAAARGLYDDLAEGDVVAVLAERPGRYDLVVAADVLVYLGDLGPVMAAAFAACRPGGAFAFTVERAGEGGAAYELGAKSRYAHAPDYVRAAAAAAGFTVVLLEDAVTRRDSGAAVPGLVAVVRRA